MHNIPHSPESREKISKSKTGKAVPAKQRPMTVIDGVEHFRCSTCQVFKPRDGFYKNRRTILGLTSACKKCHCKTSIATRDPAKHRRARVFDTAARRAKEFGASGSVARKEYDFLEKLFGDECLRCGIATTLEWDHIQPLSRGGDHSIHNLQRLCGHCNNTKHTDTADYRTNKQVDEINAWAITFKRV